MKSKLKRYKEEIIRLKEKLKEQNKDIEEALAQLQQTNREKENTNILLTSSNTLHFHFYFIFFITKISLLFIDFAFNEDFSTLAKNRNQQFLSEKCITKVV